MKRCLALLLALAILMTATISVAAQSQVTYEGDNGYTATKLSHPETGAGEVDGLIDYNGEPDRGQNYSWSSVGYGDYVYVGTCFGAIYQTLRIIAMENGMNFSDMKTLIDALYNGALYNGDEGEEITTNRSFIVKINTKTSEVSVVEGPVKSGGYRAATKMNGKLYFAATGATPYLLEIDPANNDAKQIVCYSETPQSASISTGIRGLTVYKDMLVATMIGNNGAYMVASKNPSEGPDSFKTICTQQDLLDYPAYHYMDSIFGGSIWDIIEYNDKLYITVVTGKNGHKQAFALFSGESDADGNWFFDLIAGNEADGAEYPFGLGSDRSGAANLMVHDGYLYIGGYNDPMVALPQMLSLNFEEMYRDLSSPVCLWRLDENENIEMVAGEANDVFPEGPIGNMGAGFGNNLNQYVWRMESYEGQLYVGTFDIGSLMYPIMQLTNGDIFSMSQEEWKSQIDYLKKAMEMFGWITPSTEDEATYTPIVPLGSNHIVARLASDINQFIELSENGDMTIESREKMYSLLTRIQEGYLRIRDYLPTEITDKLDILLDTEKIENFGYFLKVCAYLSRGERGFDLLVSNDGVNFDVITRDGFGDPYNHGCRVFAITDSGLCVGTANPFYGAQVWLLSTGDEEETPEYVLGDADLNGKVDIKDATLLQKYIALISTLSDEAVAVSDVDGDDKITIKDVTTIQKYVAGFDTGFSIGEPV